MRKTPSAARSRTNVHPAFFRMRAGLLQTDGLTPQQLAKTSAKESHAMRIPHHGKTISSRARSAVPMHENRTE
jgi:hypothetical protein